MSVEADLLPDGMCFAHFICTPGVFDFVPPRTLDGGGGQFGFLKAAKAYVMQDDSFGLIGCGCRVESSEVADQDRVVLPLCLLILREFY